MARGKTIDLFCGSKLVVGGGTLVKSGKNWHIYGQQSRLNMFNINLANEFYVTIDYYIPTIKFKKGIKFKKKKKTRKVKLGYIKGAFLTNKKNLLTVLSLYKSL